jgi:hypothetical protein
MKWTEDSIAYTVANHVFPWRRYVVVPNVSWGLLPHEADLVALSDSDWLSEVEIKVTKADFLADREKWKHQLAKTNGQHEIIDAFYYAMPSSVWDKCTPEDLPGGAGLILVGDAYRGDHNPRAFVKQKPTPNPRARKLRPDEREQLLRLGYMRYWCRQEAVERLLSGALREAERIDSQFAAHGSEK